MRPLLGILGYVVLRARESVGAREHRSESGHPLRSQFWKISESVRDKMYVLESGSPLGSQLGITETSEMGRQFKSFAYYTYGKDNVARSSFINIA